MCRQIEEQINIDTLETLKHAFASADVNRSGDLELEEFKQLLKKQLHLSPSKVSAGSPVPQQGECWFTCPPAR